jgi:hypothetical protein
MPINPIEAVGIADLITKVLEVRAGLPAHTVLWFRGLECATYSLLPGLMRAGKDVNEVFEREKRLLTRFRQRSIAYWPAGYPQNEWEHMFAMQHFGMPTRLLDWSENVFVATYFALSGNPRHEHDGACQAVIWAIAPVLWNRAMPGLSEYGESIQVMTTADDELESYRPTTIKKRAKSPVAIFGTHNSQRIVAQRGTFVVWGADTRPMEDVAAGIAEANLWKFILTGNKDQLFTDLQTLGFGETMVFPELPALATELNRTEPWK